MQPYFCFTSNFCQPVKGVFVFEGEEFVSLQVLYLKNLHPKVSEDDLAAVFGHFRVRDGCPRVRVLAGRMRGQAFVEFDGKGTCRDAVFSVVVRDERVPHCLHQSHSDQCLHDPFLP